MKYLTALLVTLVFTGVTFAQQPAPAQPAPENKMCHEKMEGGMMQQMDMEKRCPEAMKEGRPCCPWMMGNKMMGHRMFPGLIIAKMFFAMVFFCLIICAIMHILLSIVVFNDMRKQGEVIGLWIPIVLLGGVFAVMAYALMRKKA